MSPVQSPESRFCTHPLRHAYLTRTTRCHLNLLIEGVARETKVESGFKKKKYALAGSYRNLALAKRQTSTLRGSVVEIRLKLPKCLLEKN